MNEFLRATFVLQEDGSLLLTLVNKTSTGVTYTQDQEIDPESETLQEDIEDVFDLIAPPP